MLSGGVPWNMPYDTCIFLVSTLILPKGSFVYQENTSDLVRYSLDSRYITQENCITSIFKVKTSQKANFFC